MTREEKELLLSMYSKIKYLEKIADSMQEEIKFLTESQQLLVDIETEKIKRPNGFKE